MIQKQFLRLFQLVSPEVKYFSQQNIWQNPHVIFI